MRIIPDIPLIEGFGAASGKVLLSAVGGGGKTTLLFSLAYASGIGSKGTVRVPGVPDNGSGVITGGALITTTTKMFVSQVRDIPGTVWLECLPVLSDAASDAAISGTPDAASEVEAILAKAENLIRSGIIPVVTGPRTADKAVNTVVDKATDKKGEKAGPVPLWLPGRLLSDSGLIRLMLVEADGARMRPFKAPADHEPRIPAETTVLVPVIGADTFEGTIETMIHRSERAVNLLAGLGEKVTPSSVLTPRQAAILVRSPYGGLKDCPSGASVIPLINKCDTPDRRRHAGELAETLLSDSRIDRVIIGSLKKNPLAADMAVW